MERLLKTLFYLRRFLVEGLCAFFLLTLIIFIYSPDILGFMQAYLNERLAYYGVFEPVVALIKLSCMLSLIILSPWLLFRLSQAIRYAFGLSLKFSILIMLSGLFLFFTGFFFCFFITLPFGVNFLLQFGSDTLRPIISVERFVSFTGLFLIGFGIIFELPVIMVIVTKAGLLTPDAFLRYRKYAILLVAIAAAALTPTPDVFNMALMGIPLYVLYEIGIIVSRLFLK